MWTSLIAGLGCVVGGCLVLPSLARDEMRETASKNAAQHRGRHLGVRRYRLSYDLTVIRTGLRLWSCPAGMSPLRGGFSAEYHVTAASLAPGHSAGQQTTCQSANRKEMGAHSICVQAGLAGHRQYCSTKKRADRNMPAPIVMLQYTVRHTCAQVREPHADPGGARAVQEADRQPARRQDAGVAAEGAIDGAVADVRAVTARAGWSPPSRSTMTARTCG